jgi:hypothetical protein
VGYGSSWFDRLNKMEPSDVVLDFEPEPHRTLDGAELDNTLTVAADFIDLKSPYMAGHSRRCAQFGADAAKLLGFTDGAITTLRRTSLVSEFGGRLSRARSVTSPVRSRARSSTASSFTRCSTS